MTKPQEIAKALDGKDSKALSDTDLENKSLKFNRKIMIQPIEYKHSWHVSAKVNEQEVNFVVDSGSSATIVDLYFYYKLPESERPELRPVEKSLRVANGNMLDQLGEADFALEMGGTTQPTTILVASLGAPVGILGLDVMEERNAILDMKQGILMLDGQEIICFRDEDELIEETSEDEIEDEDAIVVPLHMKPATGTAENQPIKLLPEHLQDLVENCSPKLSQTQRQQLRALVDDYSDVFVGPDNKFGRTNVVKHVIDTGMARPIKQAPRRLAEEKQKIAAKEIEKMLEADIIEPSNSPWASPIVLVNKRDGSTRFCVDYRRLNDVTVKDGYALPNIQDIFDTLKGTKWFSTLDLASGYWQVEMDEQDKAKTAFTTRQGLFQFKVMAFGLSNAPATFQRLMETVLDGLKWIHCLVYIDDIIVFGKDFDEAKTNLQLVWQRLREANLKLKPSKSELFQTSVKYLGHVVSAEGLKCDPEKILAVKQWKPPSNVTEIRSFLGFASYYRKFIPQFATIASPLTALTKKTTEFIWSDQCDEAFRSLITKLTEAPILTYPTTTDEFVLDTDASNTGIGSVLSQIQNGEEKVIAFASKTLNNSQKNYCTTKKELLAVVTFVKHFHHYLWGRHFRIRTDHAALTWLLNFKNPEGMIARWISVLDTYDFGIEHRKGSQHGNADGLSRQMCETVAKCAREDCEDERHKVLAKRRKISHSPRRGEEDARTSESILAVSQPREDEALTDNDLDLNRASIKLMQDEDRVISFFKEKKAEGSERPVYKDVAGEGKEFITYWHIWDLLEVIDGMLCKKWMTPVTSRAPVHQLIIPHMYRKEIFKQLHEPRTGGHQGVNKTIASLKQRFYWPGYQADILRWCKYCPACARRKPGRGPKRGHLQQESVSTPFEKIAIDIMGPLEETSRGNKVIMVVCDYFTKWVEAYALPNQEAYTVADTLVTEFICRFGVPLQIHTDQGPDFESNLFQGVCKALDITKTRTTPYRPQSDGLVERMNRSLQQMLAIFVNDHRDDWDDHLPFVTMAYRATTHASTGCSANLMMFGRENYIPIDVMVGPPPHSTMPTQCPHEFVEWVRSVMHDAYEFARGNLQKAALRQRKGYNQRVKPIQFEQGNWVWYWHPPAIRRKLGQGWTGPYLIVQKLSDTLYKIQQAANYRTKIVHVDSLKPYYAEDMPPNWLTQEPPLDLEESQQTVFEEDITGEQDEEVPQEIEGVPETIPVRRGTRIRKPPKKLDL